MCNGNVVDVVFVVVVVVVVVFVFIVVIVVGSSFLMVMKVVVSFFRKKYIFFNYMFFSGIFVFQFCPFGDLRGKEGEREEGVNTRRPNMKCINI